MTADEAVGSSVRAAPGSVRQSGGRVDTAGLAVRSRIGDALPAMFHSDSFAQRWCDGLDEVLVSVPSTLDNFDAYLDPALAPIDHVEWLAAWVGIELDQNWPEEKQRKLVSTAHESFDRRGTIDGLAQLIEILMGAVAEITDGGGTAWSSVPGAELPGSDDGLLVVTIAEDADDPVDRDRLDRLVSENKPAHVAHRIEIVRTLPPPAAATSTPGAGAVDED